MASMKRCVVCDRLTAHTVTIRFPAVVTIDRLLLPICSSSCVPGRCDNLARDTDTAPPDSLVRYLGKLDIAD